MGVGEKIKEILREILSFLGGPKMETTIDYVSVALQVILSVWDLFNEKLTNAQKRELTWQMMRFLKTVPVTDFEKLVEAKRKGQFDLLEDFQMDAMIGILLADHVQKKSVIKKALGSKP